MEKNKWDENIWKDIDQETEKKKLGKKGKVGRTYERHSISNSQPISIIGAPTNLKHVRDVPNQKRPISTCGDVSQTTTKTCGENIKSPQKIGTSPPIITAMKSLITGETNTLLHNQKL